MKFIFTIKLIICWWYDFNKNRFLNDDYEIISNLEINKQGEKTQKLISDLIEEFENIWKLSRAVNNYNDICDGFEAIITKALYYR